ncbi:MAG: glyoxalase [Pseudonocardia sp.]|nr:glyoxalase [Pseudonocardia sp.]
MDAVDPVRELRLVLTVDDWPTAVRFYRDVLGLAQVADFSSNDGQVVLLSAGRATLEVVDARQAEYIDRVEVGRRVAGQVRVAFEVADAVSTTDRLTTGGAEVLAPPTRTPWDSLNARLEAPGGLQLTLFEELGSWARPIAPTGR